MYILYYIYYKIVFFNLLVLSLYSDIKVLYKEINFENNIK